ncbi:hypothetical protein IQ264_29110 [Phormidium sp. LEGE 05292]|uniref:hypothetical protein n=1 Tax=[Phormidium] sp. LEGE 05292 TaxID=767427 RepID=UPI00187E69BD|nr:hypothetical protein [Phormidium sp. LEGE 05292]MBE9229470.1 hypothetical protein [Phormidium sp. LEGE 05292]
MSTIIWEQGSNNPENADNFAIIKQWFTNLNSKEITWKQRLLPPNGDVREIDWEAQRFDEKFIIFNSDIRGITLYWQKPDSPQERNTTPSKLELDNLKQQLYVYPQSQKDVVIRLALPEIIYQKFQMVNPQVEVSKLGENNVLIFRDDKQQIEVKVALSREKSYELKQQL